MILSPEAEKYAALQVGRIDMEDIPGSYERYCMANASAINTPQPCANIVDIGGGLSGTGLILTMRTGATLHIVDGDECDGIAEKRCNDQPFNSFAVAESFLNANGLPSDRLRFHHLSIDDIPQGVDLILSFAAWGFHFPLDRYLSVIGKLRNAGRLIIDLRIQRNEIDKLMPYFTQLASKELSPKMIRYTLRRNAATF